MHFGRLENSVDIENISFSDVPDPERTQKFLQLDWGAPGKVFVACPIWACKEWIGKVYPKGTKSKDFLSVYAQHFTAIELNSTFYGCPTTEKVRDWTAQVGEDFRFCPKVTRTISEGLASGWRREWKDFCWAIAAFGENLGTTFAQFSESIRIDQVENIGRWLEQKPKEMPLAVEFRHLSWFKEEGGHGVALQDEVVDLLYRHGVAAVITDSPGKRGVRHLSLTQPLSLIRFNGSELHPSDEVRLAQWADRIVTWKDAGVQEIYFCVHQPGETLIPETVALFRRLLHPDRD